MLLFWACVGSTPPTPPEPAVPTPTVTPTPPPPETDEGTRFVATWVSPSCGERSYERQITLNPDFSFVGQDLVSPCPPGASCVWSGVVSWKGTWNIEGPRLALNEEWSDNEAFQELARPTELKHTRGTELAEFNGEELCPYAQLTPDEPSEQPTTGGPL